MELKLLRHTFGPVATIGNLFVDNKRFCYTLEDAVRFDGIKVYGKTAIPAGIYGVEVTYSPKFKKLMPLVKNVPNFTGIRFHGGNDADDSLGCILVGYDLINNEKIARSASADLTMLLTGGVHMLEIINVVEKY